MLTCVVLNYNDAPTTLKLYNQIKDYKVLDRIIVIDGKSTDTSYLELKKLENEKTTVLLADKNGGYGYGNNIGLRYSQKLGATHVLIANPDVSFEEKAIKECLKLFDMHPQVVAVAPRITGRNSAYKIPFPLLDIASASIFLNKLFHPRTYPAYYFEQNSPIEVDVLAGCLVMFDLNKFSLCGFYDENIFLYHEEIIIGQKFRKQQYISLLNMNESYQHFHSVTVKKNFSSMLKVKRINLHSQLYYLKNYADASWFTLILFQLILPLVYIEHIIVNHINSFLRVSHVK